MITCAFCSVSCWRYCSGLQVCQQRHLWHVRHNWLGFPRCSHRCDPAQATCRMACTAACSDDAHLTCVPGLLPAAVVDVPKPHSLQA